MTRSSAYLASPVSFAGPSRRSGAAGRSRPGAIVPGATISGSGAARRGATGVSVRPGEVRIVERGTVPPVSGAYHRPAGFRDGEATPAPKTGHAAADRHGPDRTAPNGPGQGHSELVRGALQRTSSGRCRTTPAIRSTMGRTIVTSARHPY